jgi:hypothetical protein
MLRQSRVHAVAPFATQCLLIMVTNGEWAGGGGLGRVAHVSKLRLMTRMSQHCAQSGTVNVAPYSYFNAVCHNPLTVVIGINHSAARPSGKKDSLLNIEATRWVGVLS